VTAAARRSPADFLWFLPSAGDQRYLGSTIGARAATPAYLRQVAVAADQLGFSGALMPTGAHCADAWITAASLAPVTERLRLLVALRPGLTLPAESARQAVTLDRISEGRLLLNVVTGGSTEILQKDGDFLDKQSRYARTAEFLHVVRQLWSSSEPVTFTGDHIGVEGAALNNRPDPVPAVFFGGSSGPAGPVAAKYSDVYLTWGEPLAAVGQKLDWVGGLAAEHGRTLRYGLRIHVISRDTSAQAWAEADRLLEGIDPADVARMQANLARSESEGQRRMVELRGGSNDRLVIAPNLWAGVGLVRGGAGTALVGSHAEVADRLAEYAQLGITHFVLSGYPHLLVGEPDDHHLALRLGGVEPEPRPRRAVGLAEGQQVVEDRRQQVDRHDHVEGLGPAALARLLELQRADADEVAGRADQRGAAPVRMRWRHEDGFVQRVLPVASEGLAGDDVPGERMRPPTGSAGHDSAPDLGLVRSAEGQRRQVEPPQRLDQAESGLIVEAEHMPLDRAALAAMNPNRLGFHDQVADGQDQPLVDQDAVSGALGSQGLRRESFGRHQRMQPHHGIERPVQIEAVVPRLGLSRRRDLVSTQ